MRNQLSRFSNVTRLNETSVPVGQIFTAPSLLDSLGTGSEAAAIDRFSFFVERAVMAPDISKVDTDRHLDPGRWHNSSRSAKEKGEM
jgi:hypothetical protein